ncbi:electron transfer flavoprotein subunit alpha/FixB family protein [Mariniluteicoccus endophyticus]
MSNVVVVAEVVDGEVTKPTLEVMTLARRLGDPMAVVFGPAAEVGPVLGEYGAAMVIELQDPAFDEYLVAPKAEAVAQVAQALEATAVLFASNMESKEVAARVAVKLDSGLITDAVDVTAEGTVQSVFAGNWTVGAQVTRGIPVVTVKPNSCAPEAAPAGGAVQPVEIEVSDAAKNARVAESKEKQASGRPELTEAAIVVSGGRGTNGDFSAVENLADALGGAVGASRAAVDSGWYPHAYQVGQTGKTVSPQLYIAAGISGAIQHRAGMQTSKAIVAVNKDDEAPIFELVDLGVVGDLHTVLPAVTEQVKK